MSSAPLPRAESSGASFLSTVLIVRDEAHNICRLADRPSVHVDKVALCETGFTDATVELAQ